MNKLVHMLPFMESNELKELAVKIINGEVKGVKVVLLYPFLKDEDLDEIVDMMIEKGKGEELRYAIPFLSNKTIDKIYDGVKNGTVTNIDETEFFPFMGKDKLKSMFNELVKEATEKAKKEETENKDE